MGPVGVVVGIVAAAGVWASSCARREATAPESAIMRVGVGVPTESSRGSGLDYLTSAMTTDSWMAQDGAGRLAERLARQWTWNEDATVLQLKMRKDVRFHDGTLLTPEVAAAAMRETLASGAYASFATVTSVEPSGDDTIVLHLSEPNSFLLTDLSLGSVTLTKNKQVLGTGAFEKVNGDAKHAELRAFPNYYRGRPPLDRVEVTTYPTQRNSWAALMRGDIDMLYDVSREAVDFVEAETTVKTYSFLRPYYNLLGFNLRHPVLKNVEVRRALNEAIDKNALVRDVLRGRGQTADGPLIPGNWAYSPPAHPFVFDPQAAGARLDAAGLKIKPVGGGRMPSRFSFDCLIFGNDARFERMAVLVQRQLADIGVDMRLVPLPQKELAIRISAGKFDAFLFEMNGRSLTWVYLFWYSRNNVPFNDSGYRSADAVLDRIRLAHSEDEIRSQVAAFEQIIHDDPPAVFLTWGETSRAVSRKFDVAGEPGRDIVPNAWNWRLAAR
jgi:peptide/nickel transport system substrate-binding protein